MPNACVQAMRNLWPMRLLLCSYIDESWKISNLLILTYGSKYEKITYSNIFETKSILTFFKLTEICFQAWYLFLLGKEKKNCLNMSGNNYVLLISKL